MKGQVQKFSLIELLVVMVVMGMLLTMAIPSFNRMISGNKVDQLASQLKLAMEQAQSRAITERRHVALILPNRNNHLSGEDNTQCEFGGCRMAFVTHKGEKEIDEDTGVRTYSEGWYFLSWVPDSAWKPAILSPRSSFRKTRRRSPIPATRPSCGSIIRKPAKSSPT